MLQRDRSSSFNAALALPLGRPRTVCKGRKEGTRRGDSRASAEFRSLIYASATDISLSLFTALAFSPWSQRLRRRIACDCDRDYKRKARLGQVVEPFRLGFPGTKVVLRLDRVDARIRTRPHSRRKQKVLAAQKKPRLYLHQYLTHVTSDFGQAGLNAHGQINDGRLSSLARQMPLTRTPSEPGFKWPSCPTFTLSRYHRVRESFIRKRACPARKISALVSC